MRDGCMWLTSTVVEDRAITLTSTSSSHQQTPPFLPSFSPPQTHHAFMPQCNSPHPSLGTVWMPHCQLVHWQMPAVKDQNGVRLFADEEVKPWMNSGTDVMLLKNAMRMDDSSSQEITHIEATHISLFWLFLSHHQISCE